MKIPFFPTIRYDLLACALRGHFLVGADARTIRDSDAVFARQYGDARFYRCLRCDTWVAKRIPRRPGSEFAPAQDSIRPPIRGRLLRDRMILRLIALDRAVHVTLLLIVAVLIFSFGMHEEGLRAVYQQAVRSFQGINGSLTFSHELVKYQGLFDFKPVHIYEFGALIVAFAALEAIEMIGLWRGRRWAEYLTFLATIVFIPYEVFELLHGFNAIKIIAFAVNVAIAVYLLYAKRLFGLNGGVAGERRETRDDSGWAYLERTAPKK